MTRELFSGLDGCVPNLPWRIRHEHAICSGRLNVCALRSGHLWKRLENSMYALL